MSKGGWADFLAKPDQGALCWTNYAILANELGQAPALLLCPTDERQPAANFARDFKDNMHLSYFVGVSANDEHPQSIQGGDRNLGPGTEPGPDYGYSPESGKGNDVAVPVNSTLKPVCWSLRQDIPAEVPLAPRTSRWAMAVCNRLPAPISVRTS